jgi:hypothetical protein
MIMMTIRTNVSQAKSPFYSALIPSEKCPTIRAVSRNTADDMTDVLKVMWPVSRQMVLTKRHGLNDRIDATPARAMTTEG